MRGLQLAFLCDVRQGHDLPHIASVNPPNQRKQTLLRFLSDLVVRFTSQSNEVAKILFLRRQPERFLVVKQIVT